MSVPRWFAVIGIVVFAVAAAILRVPVASAETQGQVIVADAHQYLGDAYCWDGGTLTPSLGPTHGEGNAHEWYGGSAASGCNNSGPEVSVQGFDCSGLAMVAVYEATGIALPHSSQAQSTYGGTTISGGLGNAEPGDLLFFGSSPSGIEHVGIYTGGGDMINAYDYKNDGDNGPNNEYWGVTEMPVSWVTHALPLQKIVRYWSGSGGGGGSPPPPAPGTDNGGSTVVSAASGRCLDVIGGGTTNGDHLQIWDCNQAPWQHWVDSGGQLQVYGNYQMCLDADSRDGGANGTPIQIYQCNGGTNQQWIAEPDGSLRSVAYGRCLDVVSGGTANGSPLQLYDCNGAPWQKWIGLPAPNGGKRVQSLHSTKCLDVPGASISPGTRVQLWECNGGAQQQWIYEGGQLRVYEDKCLDATNAGKTNGTPIQIWYCNGAEWQQWSWEPNGTIRSRWSGLCVDSINGGTANGTQLQLWECNGAPWQAWFRSTETTPAVTITSQPTAETTSTSGVFEFTGTDLGSPPVTFLCSLDGAAPSPCSPPTTYSGLAVGTHTFTVWSQNMVNHQSTPATYTWKVTAPSPATGSTPGAVTPVQDPTSSPTPSHGVLGTKTSRPANRFSALTRALAKCRRLKNRPKRAKCEAAAKKRLGYTSRHPKRKLRPATTAVASPSYKCGDMHVSQLRPNGYRRKRLVVSPRVLSCPQGRRLVTAYFTSHEEGKEAESSANLALTTAAVACPRCIAVSR